MKKNFQKLYLIILIFTPIILLILPVNFFDNGDSLCLSLVFFERECYACGMTRAIQHLIHFDFSVGYEYNKLSIIVFPFLIIAYCKEIKRVLDVILLKNI